MIDTNNPTVESVLALVEENRKLREENERLKRDPFRGLPKKSLSLGCARASDLLRLDEDELAQFDLALREFLDWVLSRPNGWEDLKDRVFSMRLRNILQAFSIGYMDGSDDRRRNIDLRSAELPAEQRLSAYISDRRFWIFKAEHANHETVLAADTLLRLCEWRQILTG